MNSEKYIGLDVHQCGFKPAAKCSGIGPDRSMEEYIARNAVPL
jgi:hypothetical protein